MFFEPAFASSQFLELDFVASEQIWYFTEVQSAGDTVQFSLSVKLPARSFCRFLGPRVRTTVLILFVLGICASQGCRTLRTNRHTRNLSAARQLSLRGMGLLEQEKHEDAATLFSEALEHSPADERAHWGLAEVQWENGNHQDALLHMSQAVELSGQDGQQDPDLMVRLGELYREAGNMQSAQEYADAALSIDRQHALAWSLKGAVLQAKDQPNEAMDCFQRSLIHNPTNSNARVAVAKLYRELGQPQRALATIDFLSDGHTAEEVPAQAWMLKGLALADLGEAAEAKLCLRNASRCADIDDHPLLLELASEYHRFGDSAEARVLLGMVMQNDPNNPTALALQTTLSQAFSGDRPRLNSFPAGSVSPAN